MQFSPFERSPENTCMFASTPLWCVSLGLLSYACPGRWAPLHTALLRHSCSPATFHMSEGFRLREEWVALVNEASTPFFGPVQRGGGIFRDRHTPNVLDSMFCPVGMASETTGLLNTIHSLRLDPSVVFKSRTKSD